MKFFIVFAVFVASAFGDDVVRKYLLLFKFTALK